MKGNNAGADTDYAQMLSELVKNGCVSADEATDNVINALEDWLMYDSFRDELEHKNKNIPTMDIMNIKEQDGTLFVDFIGSDAPGYEMAPDYGYDLKTVVDEETAAEHGAAEGCKVAVYQPAESWERKCAQNAARLSWSLSLEKQSQLAKHRLSISGGQATPISQSPSHGFATTVGIYGCTAGPLTGQHARIVAVSERIQFKNGNKYNILYK